jgi:hypothetical protein
MYENDECEIPIEIPQETPAIKAIKSSLLWGELNNIWWWLIVISYNNLIVSEIDLKYNFEIRNAKFNYAKNNTNEKYNWCFNSKYIFEEKVFENPEISIYNDRGSKLLAWNKVNFVWKFKITEVKNDFISLFNNLSILSNVLNDINNNLGISQLTITYSSDNNIDLRNEELQIYIKWNQITSVVYNSKKLISRPIEISDLNEALQLMK